MTISVQERVELGAMWLDENFPQWELKVNLQTLRLASPSECILGQVCDWKLEHSTPMWPNERGFYTTADYEYPLLDEAWRDLIKARLDAGIKL